MSANAVMQFGEADAPAAIDPKEVSEDVVASQFTAKHRDTMRFCHHAGRWFEWDGVRWKRDDTQRAFHFARELARLLSASNKSMCKASVASGAERFARADPAHSVTADRWDSNKWLLGTPGGIVDLKEGKLRRPDPSAYITRLTGVAPSSEPPTRWLEFLNQTTGGDAEMIAFLQRLCGYLLTGDTSEHALFFIYGPGGNGKSVFLNMLQHILADYAETAAMDTFTASMATKHPTDLAMLKGARGVFASETEAGSNWAEARIKALTGGDRITARFMRQDFFTYAPEFKLVIVGNHAPSIKNVDEALRRRFNIIPFTRKPTKPDPMLEDKLRAEAGQILGWMIEGCQEWQKRGLGRPKAIVEATDTYFAEQDVMGQWLAECTRPIDSFTDTATELFTSWSDFAKANGEQPGTIRQFSMDMEKRGFRRRKTMHGRFFVGVQVKPREAAKGHYDD
jgi:putative DNA primase/helicase